MIGRIYLSRTVPDSGCCLPSCVACAQAMLSIGAAMLGARHVTGLDVDADALETAQSNCDMFEEPLPVSSTCWAQVCRMRGTITHGIRPMCRAHHHARASAARHSELRRHDGALG